jgi:GDSL-like Lipase/Acylhydrolase family
MYPCLPSATFWSLIHTTLATAPLRNGDKPIAFLVTLFHAILLWASLLALNAVSQDPSPSNAFNPANSNQVTELLAPFKEAAKKWEDDVEKLCKTNTQDGGDEHVLFIGSSSFRLWDNLPEDLAPYPIVKRAYGGAKFRDLAIYTPELVRGVKFNRAMIFIANEITGKEDDTPPETTRKLAHLVIEQLRREQPNSHVFLLAVTPTPSRYEYWPRIQKTNQMLKSLANELQNVHYIPTATAFLDADGLPRAEYFKDDRLHLNHEGYAVWSELIKRALAEVAPSRSK